MGCKNTNFRIGLSLLGWAENLLEKVHIVQCAPQCENIAPCAPRDRLSEVERSSINILLLSPKYTETVVLTPFAFVITSLIFLPSSLLSHFPICPQIL